MFEIILYQKGFTQKIYLLLRILIGKTFLKYSVVILPIMWYNNCGVIYEIFNG